MSIHSTKTRQPTTVDTIPAVTVIAVVTTVAITAVRVVALRKRARDLAIATPAGRKVTGPGSVLINRLMRKTKSGKHDQIARMTETKVLAGKHSAEWLSDSREMGDLTAV
jgi:hypothetical protein